MRRTLGALLLTAALAMPALAGCAGSGGGNGSGNSGNGGNDGADTRAQDSSASGSPSAPDPAATPTSTTPTGSPSPATGEAVDFTEVALLSLTGGGGTVGFRATVLNDRAAVNRFAAQFESPALGTQLRKAVRNADVPDDQVLAASVVSIGCDVPPGVVVQRLPDGLAIVPRKVTSPLQECLAPVTTMAVVAVDETAL